MSLFKLFVFAHSGVHHVLNIRVAWWVSYKRQKLLTLREHLGSPSVFGGVRVAHLFSFLCHVLFVLRPVHCMPGVVSVPELTIVDSPFGFLWCL